jgi:methionyl-tRNA synthetase
MTESELGIVVATVEAAEPVPGTKRLHKITVRLAVGETRTIASGVPGDFPAGHLVGKQIPILVAVEPVKIRGIESQARLLATQDADGRTVLLGPAQPVPDGSKVW